MLQTRMKGKEFMKKMLVCLIISCLCFYVFGCDDKNPTLIGSKYLIAMAELQKDLKIKEIYPLERNVNGTIMYPNSFLVRMPNDSVWIYEVSFRAFGGEPEINKAMIFSGTINELERK